MLRRSHDCNRWRPSTASAVERRTPVTEQFYPTAQPHERRRIPFHGQGGVTQEELDALAERLVEASGWTLEHDLT
jgi:hypothetical protein